MKILVINICLRPYMPYSFPPVGLGYIVTAIERAGLDFEILDIDAYRYSDEQVEKFLRTKRYDIVAMGCLVGGYKIVKSIAKTIKDYKDVPIIVGNSVATSIPELLLTKTKVDIAVMGEGDVTIIELLQAIINNTPLEEVKGIYFKKGGKIIATPRREVIPDIDDIPFINWDLFDIDTYLSKSKLAVPEPYPTDFDSLIAMPVNTARGCLYKCGFCYHVFRDNKYRPRSPRSICSEIKLLKEKYGVNFIYFFDELSLYSKAQCHELCDELLRQNLHVAISACCRVGLFGEEDLSLARKLKEAGFYNIGYSLESGNPEILKAMNKHISVERFNIQTKVLQEAGIVVTTSLVVGYPQETEETINRTFDICYENSLYPSVGYIIPQPGTPIYDYAVKVGKIRDEEEYLLSVIGDRQDFRINLTQMQQSDIESLVKRHLKRISDKLGLGLDESRLIKTSHIRSKKENNQRQ